MTNRIPADKVRKLAARFRQEMEPHTPAAEYRVWERATEAVESLLPPPPRPTLEDMTPALPDGWRLADHPDYGRVIVTTKNLVRDGYMGFIHRADPINAGHGSDWCKPDELTYIDTPDAVPPNTLAVGSEWDDADALARACDKSERDQIIALDADGYAYVWSHDAEWWEGSMPPQPAPCTIIHTGKKADQ